MPAAQGSRPSPRPGSWARVARGGLCTCRCSPLPPFLPLFRARAVPTPGLVSGCCWPRPRPPAAEEPRAGGARAEPAGGGGRGASLGLFSVADPAGGAGGRRQGPIWPRSLLSVLAPRRERPPTCVRRGGCFPRRSPEPTLTRVAGRTHWCHPRSLTGRGASALQSPGLGWSIPKRAQRPPGGSLPTPSSVCFGGVMENVVLLT